MAIAAPRPVFGLFYYTALHWIAVDVAQFFDELGTSKDVEIVIVGQPKVGMEALEVF